MLDFIYMGSAELLGEGEKIQNKNIGLQLDSNPHPTLHDR